MGLGTPKLTSKTWTDVAFMLSNPDCAYTKPITMGIDASAGSSANGVIAAGTAIAIKSSDDKGYEYDDNGSGGLETCVGILLEPVDVSVADKESVYVRGFAALDESKCTGIDANGKTDLGDTIIWE